MEERLKNNIAILKQHNLTHQPVYHITDGKKHEVELINEIVEDCEKIFNDEEQGLIVRLPCKIDTFVYAIDKFTDRIICGTLTNIEIGHFGITYTVLDGEYSQYYHCRIVFLTQAEAEKEREKLVKEQI